MNDFSISVGGDIAARYQVSPNARTGLDTKRFALPIAKEYAGQYLAYFMLHALHSIMLNDELYLELKSQYEWAKYMCTIHMCGQVSVILQIL